MNAILLMLMLAGDLAATCPMHAKHTATEVDQRGDKVMGFSHEKTKHTFRLLEDGGAIEVRANDGADAESIAAIRSHMREIAKEFTAGTFTKPQEIHARMPDGVDVIKELGAAVTFQYEELERGARVRVKTEDARGREAVHAFLRFQIKDHRTGDHE
ncbi:MAG TPA: hypothetical protein VEK79_14335 [Thermoanaerobaculia bacterium]|nr:hypothetical protein [Thermoanaerobaculia bacterium]